MAYVQGCSACAGTFVHSRKDALELCRRVSEATAKPFLFLSAGVSNRVFNEALELASEAGVRFCGVLCGRATWKDGVGVFIHGGAEALQKWLEADGVQNIRAINTSLRHATPWSENYPPL
jgi:tagatose 1,6-diphosphate aldolase